MTKKDYIIIAKAIRPIYQNTEQPFLYVIDKIVNNIAHECMQDNPRFDEIRFREAIYK